MYIIYCVIFQVHVLYPKGLDHGNKCASCDNMAQHIQEISKHMPKPTAPPQPSNTRECLTLWYNYDLILCNLNDDTCKSGTYLNGYHTWSSDIIFDNKLLRTYCSRYSCYHICEILICETQTKTRTNRLFV